MSPSSNPSMSMNCRSATPLRSGLIDSRIFKHCRSNGIPPKREISTSSDCRRRPTNDNHEWYSQIRRCLGCQSQCLTGTIPAGWSDSPIRLRGWSSWNTSCDKSNSPRPPTSDSTYTPVAHCLLSTFTPCSGTPSLKLSRQHGALA